jgi:hypothetical protein
MKLFDHHVTGKELMQLYSQNNFDEVCKRIIDMLHDFESSCYTSIGSVDQSILDDTVAAILFIFSQSEFNIPENHIPTLITMNHLMANLIAVSSYETTDSLLRHIMHQTGNFAKILVMYSCRNQPMFNQDVFFDLNSKLATLWWITYSASSCGSPTKLLADNISRHYSKIPDKFNMVLLLTSPAYFDCTYAIPQKDREIKTVLNQQIRNRVPYFKTPVKTSKKKIAVITGRWYPTSAVYKSSAHQLEALGKKYDLTLVHLGVDSESLAKTQFKDVICTGDISKGNLDLSIFQKLDCHLAYIPDVGMSNESVILANLRLAPIMVTGYGHPSSTFGSLCDYYIGGQETEVAEKALENYSERLVLVPGLGAHPVFPNYTRRNPSFERPIINCAWTSPKINYTMLCNLRKILDRVPNSMVRLFPAWTIGRYNSMIPCIRDLTQMFGDEFVLLPELPYEDYLIELEKGTIALDSWPFGGYNTIVDSFFVGCPALAIEGTRFYNRASSALLRRVGLSNLVCKSQEEYVDKAVELLTKSEKLEEARSQVASVDRLKSLLCDNDEPQWFVKAFDFILENHNLIQKSRDKGPFYVDL